VRLAPSFTLLFLGLSLPVHTNGVGRGGGKLPFLNKSYQHYAISTVWLSSEHARDYFGNLFPRLICGLLGQSVRETYHSPPSVLSVRLAISLARTRALSLSLSLTLSTILDILVMAMPDTVSDKEMALITISIACSVLLTVLSAARNGVISPLKYPKFQLALGAVVFLACFGCGFVGLILAWTHFITLEVFGVAIIGLIPAFQALVDLFPTMFAQAIMGKKRSLNPSSKCFRYIRFDRGVTRDDQGVQVITDHELCYIRLEASHNRPLDCSVENQVWYGFRVAEKRDANGEVRAIKLCDMANGKNFLWWRAIVGASRVVARPHDIGLNTQAGAVAALSILSDIVIIGDLLLQHHGDFLAKTFNENMNDFSDPNRASPDLLRSSDYAERMRLRSLRHRVETCAVVCNLIINRLQLDGWGPIDHRFKKFPVGSSAVRARKYAALFFMVCLESQLFLNIPKRWCGPDIINLIWDEEPSKSAEAMTEWLTDLGFKPTDPSDPQPTMLSPKASHGSHLVPAPVTFRVIVHDGATLDLPPPP
jgi:hypothetical protein